MHLNSDLAVSTVERCAGYQMQNYFSSFKNNLILSLPGDQQTFGDLSTTAESKMLIPRLFGDYFALDIPFEAKNQLKLVYSSKRAKSHRTSIHLLLLYIEKIPTKKLKRVHLDIKIAGQRFRKYFYPAPMLSHTFYWDRKNAFGQPEYGFIDAYGKHKENILI